MVSVLPPSAAVVEALPLIFVIAMLPLLPMLGADEAAARPVLEPPGGVLCAPEAQLAD